MPIHLSSIFLKICKKISPTGKGGLPSATHLYQKGGTRKHTTNFSQRKEWAGLAPARRLFLHS